LCNFAAVKKIVYLVGICLVTLLLTACSQKELVQAPADLMGQDTVVQIMADQLIIESTIYFAPPEYDKNAASKDLYSQLFKKYGVSVERYERSLSYYFSNQERMEKMMDEVHQLVEEKRRQSVK